MEGNDIKTRFDTLVGWAGRYTEGIQATLRTFSGRFNCYVMDEFEEDVEHFDKKIGVHVSLRVSFNLKKLDEKTRDMVWNVAKEAFLTSKILDENSHSSLFVDLDWMISEKDVNDNDGKIRAAKVLSECQAFWDMLGRTMGPDSDVRKSF